MATGIVTVKQLILRLAAAPNRASGDMTGAEADAHVNEYLANGWKLAGQPMPVGRDNEAIQIYYCLIMEGPNTTQQVPALAAKA